jgi:phage repressor protein C with HTH and peptisase S24 domain
VGVNHQAVHNWLEGTRQPGAKALTAIWRVYRVDPLWLLTGETGVQGPVVLRVSPPSVPKPALTHAAEFLDNEVERDRFVSVPLLSDAIAAGSPREIRPQDIEDFAIIYADWLPAPEMVTCVRISGESMAPILTEGSIVAIDHSQRDARKLDGKMVAFRQDGGASVKWCKHHSPELVMGLPENKETMDSGGLLVFQGDEVNECIVGRVVWWWGLAK